jgi:RNA polymerase sigma-70 factor (ECF subfamily)
MRGLAVEAGNWYGRSVMDTARTVGMALEGALPATSEEAAFVAELQAGSEDAFAYLLAVYQNPVYNFVSHILANPAEAADVLQDVFIKVFKGIGQFHGDSSLKTWIYRIAVHEASNHRRGWMRRQWREPFSIDDMDAKASLSAAEARVSSETPYQLLEQAEREEMLRRALGSLTQPYRAVVVLRDVEGMSYDEIARLTGMAEGTVKSRLMRGRELLRQKLVNRLGKVHV